MTEIVDHIQQTYFYGIRQMGMKDKALIDKINLRCFALTAMAIHHCQSAWQTGVFRVPPEVGPRGGAQSNCDTRNINHAGSNACTAVYRHLDMDFCSSLPEVQAKKIGNICSMIRRWIHSTGIYPAMAQPHNEKGRFDEDFLDHVPQELIAQPNNYFNRLSSFVAATEVSMRLSAVLPMGGSAIGGSSRPIPCSDGNYKSNKITSITTITSVENTWLIDGSMIVEGAILLGG